MWRSTRAALAALALLSAPNPLLAQSSFMDLTPGRSTRQDAGRALGRPTQTITASTAEYPGSAGISSVRVAFSPADVIERIDVALAKPVTRGALLASFGLPEREGTRTTSGGRLVEYFGESALLAFTYATPDPASGVVTVGHFTATSFAAASGQSVRSGTRTPSGGNTTTGPDRIAGTTVSKGGVVTTTASRERLSPLPGTGERGSSGTATRPGALATSAGRVCGYTLTGAILDRYFELGGETGPFKCPAMNEDEAGRSPQGTAGRYVKFAGIPEGSAIHWHRTGRHAGKAFETHGGIYALYSQLGGSTSWLGFPVSDEYDVPGGRRSDFEGGYIVWDARTAVPQAFRR